MKKIILVGCCLLNFFVNCTDTKVPGIILKAMPDTQALLPADSTVVDEVMVVIYGSERTRVITRLEVERLSIEGRKRSLEDLIIEELLYQEAIKFKVQIDESVIDRYIGNIRKQYKLSLDDVKQIFKQSGYTYEEGREQLRMMYATNGVVENIIISRLHVAREDVLAYYEQHPVVIEAEYTLSTCMVQFDATKTREEQHDIITRSIKRGKADSFPWSNSFVLKESEIAQGVDFIKTMKAGDIATPVETNRGFELYSLLAVTPERFVPLEARYKEIEAILRQPQFEKKMEEYKKTLYEFATIVYYQ